MCNDVVCVCAQLDYLRYIRELVDVDAPATATRSKILELSSDGLAALLDIIRDAFLDPYEDDAEVCPAPFPWSWLTTTKSSKTLSSHCQV